MKVKINLPFVGKKNRFAFNSNHETTLNFGSFVPVYGRDLAPNETLTVDTRLFARVAPMLVPTFGDVRIKMHSYFVPYTSVWDYFDDFITGRMTPTPDGSVGDFMQYTTPPVIYNRTLVNMFAYGVGFVTQGNANNYDFCISDGGSPSPQPAYYRFTRAGKNAYHILQSLGYNIRFDFTDSDVLGYNALPLLGFFKLYFEHFVPQQYKFNHQWRNFTQWLHEQTPVNGIVEITQNRISDLFGNLVLAYQQDYFTAMWNDVNMVRNGMVDFNNNYYATMYTTNAGSSPSDEVVDVGTNGTTIANSSANEGVSPWAVRMAEKVQGWLTRNNLAGSDYINRILANFGIKPVERLGVVKYCGSYETQLKIDSVFDTAGSTEAPLGSYAGRGMIMGNSPKFDVSTQEHGFFFVMCSVQPVAVYTDGVDRHLLYRDRFDYFTPDFDGLGMQGVAQCELFNSFNDYNQRTNISNLGMNNPQSILGFNPRYAERKYDKCRVTGDFNVRSFSALVAPYSLQRNLFVDKFDISKGFSFGQKTSLTLSDIVFQTDAVQYNRIFAETTGLPDPIFALFDFNVKMISPMKQLGESFEQFNSDSNSVKLDKNGQYSN